jgi:hypothetical protein
MSLFDDVKNLVTTSQQYIKVGSNAVSDTFHQVQNSVSGAISDLLPGSLAQEMPSAQQKATDLAQVQVQEEVEGDPNATTDQLLSPDGLTTPDYKGFLQSKVNPGDMVVFNVTPVVDESRQAAYDPLQPVHHPGAIQIYKTTGPRSLTVSGKFIARTMAEADETLRNLEIIRSWVMPYYGLGTANGDSKERLGAPPDILEFSIYGSRTFDKIPVILKSYQWSLPDNIDYVPDYKGNPCPTILEVHLSLEEAYTPEQFTNFSIDAYKAGDMAGAYSFSGVPKE